MLKKFINKIKPLKIRTKVYANVVKRNRISYKLLLSNGFRLNSEKKKYYELKLKI
jgi:sRNA-binding regulator protein Hfq